MRKRSRDFADALRAIRDELHLTQTEFGARVDASPRTLSRWEVDGELPHVAQRTHMVHKLAGLVSAGRLQELVDAMGVEDLVDAAALSATARHGNDTHADRTALGPALLALAEQLDVSPRRARAALVAFLAAAAAAGLTVERARAAVAATK